MTRFFLFRYNSVGNVRQCKLNHPVHKRWAHVDFIYCIKTFSQNLILYRRSVVKFVRGKEVGVKVFLTEYRGRHCLLELKFHVSSYRDRNAYIFVACLPFLPVKTWTDIPLMTVTS